MDGISLGWDWMQEVFFLIIQIIYYVLEQHHCPWTCTPDNFRLIFFYRLMILERQIEEMMSKLTTNLIVRKLTHKHTSVYNLNIKYRQSFVSFHHRHTCSGRSNMDAMNYRRIEKLSCNINRIPFIYNIPTLFLSSWYSFSLWNISAPIRIRFF